MAHLAFAILGIFIILVLSEFLWRKNLVRGEFGRKLVHILCGTYVAFWPWFLSFRSVFLISIAFVVVTILSRKLKIFHAILDIKRKSAGDVLFAFGVCATALVTTNRLIFSAAILFMALADAFAAILGKKYGKRSRYYLLGAEKSILGSSVFFLTTLTISLVFWVLYQAPVPIFEAVAFFLPLAISLSVLLTVVEAISPYGFDNVLIPLVGAVALKLFSL